MHRYIYIYICIHTYITYISTYMSTKISDREIPPGNRPINVLNTWQTLSKTPLKPPKQNHPVRRFRVNETDLEITRCQ